MDYSNIERCRTCLGPLELPVNLFESSYNNLLGILQRLLSFQIYKHQPKEFNVCRNCQGTLVLVSDFQSTCLQSLDSLRNSDYSKFDGSNGDIIKTEQTDDESIMSIPQVKSGLRRTERLSRKRKFNEGIIPNMDDVEQSDEVDRNDPFGDDSDLDDDYPIDDSKGKKKRRQIEKVTNKLKTGKRLERFPQSEVLEALEEVERFYTDKNNTHCIYCSFVCGNVRALFAHMGHSHKNVKNWCKNCNVQTEDLQAHLDRINCHIWSCKFCKRGFARMPTLKQHYKIHSAVSMPSETSVFRLQQFPVNEVVNAIEETRGVQKSSTDKLCKFCNQKYKNMEGLRDHLRRHCREKMKKNLIDNCDIGGDVESVSTLKVRTRLKKFPKSEVLEAVKEIEDAYTAVRNRQCLYCDFLGVNIRALSSHMKITHRDVDDWCKNCNVKTEDLQVHAMQCHIWKCKFCKKDISKLGSLRHHYKFHSISKISYSTVYRLKQFPFNDVIQAIHNARSMQQTYVTLTGGLLCKFCKRKFATADNLIFHLRNHCRIRMKKVAKEFNVRQETVNGDTDKDDIEYIRDKRVRLKKYPMGEMLGAIKEIEHYYTAVGKRQCIYCDYLGDNIRGLFNHMWSTHRDVNYKWCKHCNIETDNLKTHLDSVQCHIWRCKFCNKACSRMTALKQHYKFHFTGKLSEITLHRLKQFPLTEVANALQETSAVKQSFIIITGVLCKLCNEKFKKVADLRTHLRRHCVRGMKRTVLRKVRKPARSGNCTICQKNFRYIALHMIRIHNQSEAPNLCAYCGKKYSSLYALKMHIVREHDNFKCSLCKESFPSAYEMKLHKKQTCIVKADPFGCEICGGRFVSKWKRNEHMERHKMGPLKCIYCDKSFNYRTGFKMHLKQHTGDCLYQCIPCSKSFPYKSMLELHMARHSNIRPYVCNVCGTGFKEKATLRKHEWIHKERRYRCSICSFACVQAHSLTTHMKQHPEDAPQASKPHQCSDCYRAFTTNALLLCHYDNCHRRGVK